MSTIADLVSDQERAALVGVSDTLQDALGVAVPVARLEALAQQDRSRLRALCRELRRTPERQVPSLDQRSASVAFADALERLPGSKRLKREQAMIASYAKLIGFIPTVEERRVFRGVGPDATLDSLRGELARVAPEWRGLRVAWDALAEGEAEELEGLVEAAITMPGFFAERRGEAGSGLRVGMLARRAEEGPARRSVSPAGWVAIPPGLLDDVHRGSIHPLDLTIFATVALTIATRRIDPGQERFVRLDGDSVIADDSGRRLLANWDPQAHAAGDLMLTTRFSSIVARLERAGWLETERLGQALRIRLGARFAADG